MDAKAYLKQIKLYDTHIDNKLEELKRLKDMVLRITSTMKDEVVSSSGNQDKFGDTMAKIVDLQDEINKTVDEYIDLKAGISAVVDLVTDADELAVLCKRYMQYKTWEQIADEMHMTYRNVCYIHGRALQTVNRLIGYEGRVEVVSEDHHFTEEAVKALAETARKYRIF